MKPDGKWWDQSWNPVTGCTPVSAGCTNCWAKRMHARQATGRPFSQIVWHDDRLEQPIKWRRPRRVAVCLMGDLFHDDVEDSMLMSIFSMMGRCQQHTFMLLTKRVGNFGAFLSRHGGMWETVDRWPYPNVWLGTSVEDQATADERIPHLLKCPTARRFVSIEPMLGPVLRLKKWLRRLDWVIVGSESGPRARSMHLDWVRSIRDQCVDAGVPFFFKQMMDGCLVGRRRKKRNMPELDGVVWDQMPEVTVPLRPEELVQ